MSDRKFRWMEYHQRLDRQLHDELQRRWPDSTRIQKLKKLKLRIKDRLNQMMTARKGRPNLAK